MEHHKEMFQEQKGWPSLSDLSFLPNPAISRIPRGNPSLSMWCEWQQCPLPLPPAWMPGGRWTPQVLGHSPGLWVVEEELQRRKVPCGGCRQAKSFSSFRKRQRDTCQPANREACMLQNPSISVKTPPKEKARAFLPPTQTLHLQFCGSQPSHTKTAAPTASLLASPLPHQSRGFPILATLKLSRRCGRHLWAGGQPRQPNGYCTVTWGCKSSRLLAPCSRHLQVDLRAQQPRLDNSGMAPDPKNRGSRRPGQLAPVGLVGTTTGYVIKQQHRVCKAVNPIPFIST